MAVPLVALAAISAGANIWAAEEQSRLIKANAEFQKKIANLNKELAKIDETQVYKYGQEQQLDLQSQVDQTRDAQTAVLAANGITDTRGSVGDLLAQSELNTSLMSQKIEKQTEMSAAQIRRQAQQAALQSEYNYISEMDKARVTRLSGYLSAASSGANLASMKGK